MAKSQSPAKARGRPKSKSEPKVEKERSKSRGRKKSTSERGRSPAPKAKKPSAKRSASKSRSRTASRSRSRKSEPKPARSRSSSRPAAKKPAVTPEKKAEAPSTRPRRTVASREAKPKTVVDGPSETPVFKRRPTIGEIFGNVSKKIKGFGYRATASGILWHIVLPLYVWLLHLFCTRDKCLPRWPIVYPKNLSTYADPTFIGYGVIIILTQILLSAIPVGSVVTGFGYRRAIYKYRSNGLFCLAVSFGTYLALVHYTKFPHAAILINNRFKAVCAMTVVSILVSGFLYIKAKVLKNVHTNHGCTTSPRAIGNLAHDLAHGLEVSPKLGESIDLGLVLLRATNFIWAVCLYTAVQLSLGNNNNLNYNVLFLAAAQGTHILIGSYNEIYILKSAFINQGVGFVQVFSCLVVVPFCHTLPIRFVLDNSTKNEILPVYVALYAIYAVGLILIFHTNAAKYNNARAGGKKVVRTGCYAIVRHPNYLGELVCLITATAMCGFTLIPWVHVGYLASLIVCRIYLMERSTNYEYKQYAEQVRSRLVPFIF